MGNRRERGLEAARLVDRLLVDVIVSTRSLEIFDGINSRTAIQPTVFHGMRRMCHSQTLLGLSRFGEFYGTYHDLIPRDCKAACKLIKKVIESKRIYEFRSKYVAHLINKKTGRPLNLNELEQYLEGIFGQDEKDFIGWVNDKSNVFPTTVVSVLEKTRDEIMKEYGITKEEMSPW